MHMSAHLRQLLAQSIIIMSPAIVLSHIVAHIMHISAHMSHMRMAIAELRIMKSAVIWHIWPQSIIIFIIFESQVPISMHFMVISVQQR